MILKLLNFVEPGGAMSYGVSLIDLYRRADRADGLNPTLPSDTIC